MPKKSKAKLSNKVGANRLDQGSDEDNVFNDDASVISNVSCGSSMKDEVTNGAEGGVDELSQEEAFEEKLRDAMDLASQKSAQGRTMALESMCTAFNKKFIPEFVEDRRMTITDIVEKALKRGKCAEQVAAAKLAVLFCVQLGGSPDAESVLKDLQSVFITLLSDPAAPLKSRAAVASALGDCAFLVSSPQDYEINIMPSLEKIFSVKTGSNDPEDLYALQTAALSAWTLLYSLLPPSRALNSLDTHMALFEQLLEAANVDLRIAAGEAVVVLYESAYDHDDEASLEMVELIIPRLQELAKDSHKYHAKKDRKVQKSSFRDILKYIEDEEDLYERIAFSKRETLEITSWGMKKQYDNLCKVLGSGMNLHLSDNDLVRSIFGLGAPLPALDKLSSKPSKHERQYANQQAFKWRTQTRGKNRDKRSAVV